MTDITMPEDPGRYNYKYDIKMSGNDGLRVISGVEQKGIVIFNSSSPDIDDILVHPIPESYPEILTALDSTIEFLYKTGHEGMRQTNFFDW